MIRTSGVTVLALQPLRLDLVLVDSVAVLVKVELICSQEQLWAEAARDIFADTAVTALVLF